MPTREDIIATARGYIGASFGHQGRTRNRLDCGGLVLMMARDLKLSELEVLGYADFPVHGRFEELLREHSDYLGTWTWPFRFDGSEVAAGDILSFDYGNGEGTRHTAIVTAWDGRRYRVVEAQPVYGVSEHALAPPFVNRNTTLKGWRVRGVEK